MKILILAIATLYVVVATHAAEAKPTSPKKVDFANLMQKSSGPGTHYLYEKGHEDTPFTGIAFRKFPDGRKTETHFVKGKGNGLSVMWHPNGKKAMEVTLVNDKPHGQMTMWDNKGKVTAQKTYKNGKEVKPSK